MSTLSKWIWMAVALWPLAATAQDSNLQPATSNLPSLETRHQVTVGMYINDIQTINLTTYSYSVDLYLWFRWKDPDLDPVAQFEFMNSFDPDSSVRTVLYDKPLPQPDGSLYQIVRHQGLFSAKFPLHDYPFDRQTLIVAVEDSQLASSQLVYTPDTIPLVLNPEIKLPGFNFGEPKLDISDHQYPTSFGDLAMPEASTYSRAEFLIPISRPPLAGLTKAFIPVLLIILSAGFALLLDPIHVEARIGLSITALLTLVAMQFTMLSGLPEVAYLTLIDQVYLLSYLYILVVLGLAVYSSRVDKRGDIQGNRPVDPRRELLLSFRVTGTYLAVLGGIVWINLMT